MDFILSEAGHDRRELDRLAPTRMEVPSGSHMTIHYEATSDGGVRLQKFRADGDTRLRRNSSVVMTLCRLRSVRFRFHEGSGRLLKRGVSLVRKDMRGRYRSIIGQKSLYGRGDAAGASEVMQRR